MRELLTLIFAILIAGSVMAEQHDSAEAEVRDAVIAFNAAYAGNDVEAYFGHYAEGASVYFYGARQDLSAYHDEWASMIAAGGGVERNELSELQVQLLPGGHAAVATYFVDYRMRTPDGEVSEARAFESDVWQIIDGVWKLVNVHYSEIADHE
jgi:ketosteroid isomerase-like protein